MCETMAAARHPLRSYVIGLLKAGELVSVAEAVLVCDASPQAVRKWIKADGIDVEARRLAHVAKFSTNAQRYLEGKPALRKPTKAQMRDQLERAIERFNRANAKPSAPLAGSERPGKPRSARAVAQS